MFFKTSNEDNIPTQPTIRFHMLQGRNLAPKDLNGYSDPFVTIKCGDFKVKTSVVKKTLNPDWYQVLELKPDLSKIPTVIKLTCWDKDAVKKDFMGEIKVSIASLFDEDGEPKPFDDNPASASWHTLQRRTESDLISGEIKFQVGFYGFEGHRELLRTLFEAVTVTRSFEGLNLNGSTTTASTLSMADSINTTRTLDGANGSVSGLLFIDVISASDLPWEKNATGSSFDMDPFTVVSFGSTTFKTSTIRHNLNPVWNERIVFQVNPELQNFSIKFSLYDYDKFSNNDFVGSAQIPFVNVLAATSASDTASSINGEAQAQGKTFPLALELTSEFLKQRFMSQLLIRAEFVPTQLVRQNFWTALTKTYDIDENGNMNKTEISTMLASIEGTIPEEIIDEFFFKFNKNPASDELTFIELAECLEELASHKGAGASLEQVFKIDTCPICQKKLNQINDLDTVSHIAVCASKDPSKIDRIVMGNFITEANAQRKWFTKIASYISYGEYKVGENNANIIVQDRITGEIFEEKMPTYIKLGIRLLYKNSINAAENSKIKKVFQNMSIKQGKKYDDPISTKEIEPFINFHKLNRDEILDPLDSFKSFNEFFYRKLKSSARILGNEDPNVAVSPADARVMVFPSIDIAQELWIKGEKFSIAKLFGHQLPTEDVNSYTKGSLAIFRLAPQDYHRFHIPVDGIISEPVDIEGEYYTVNPMAIRSNLDVYGENKRCFSIIESLHHGRVAMICIGAMMVGSIILTSKPNMPIKRLDEHGYFAFGGSTILVLFQEGQIQFDADLLNNSAKKLETLLRVGSTIGVSSNFKQL